MLAGDNIRHGLNKDLGFSPEDRKENIRRIGEVAKLFIDAGVLVMTAFISPYREDRDMVRGLVEDGEFIEVYVKCSLEECERRDPKGMYRKARIHSPWISLRKSLPDLSAKAPACWTGRQLTCPRRRQAGPWPL